MNHQIDDTQYIEEFNSSLDGLQPDQVLCAFAKLLNQSAMNSDTHVAVVTLNAFRRREFMIVEVEENPQEGTYPLAIHGGGFKGKGFKEHTFLGPMECLTRIRRGVQRVIWKNTETQKINDYRQVIKNESHGYKKKVRQWLKSMSEIESVVTAWYEDQFAEMRQARIPPDSHQYRQELMEIEKATPLLYRVLSQFDHSPTDAAFESSRVIFLDCNFAKQ